MPTFSAKILPMHAVECSESNSKCTTYGDSSFLYFVRQNESIS